MARNQSQANTNSISSSISTPPAVAMATTMPQLSSHVPISRQVSEVTAQITAISQEDLDTLMTCLSQIACMPFGFANDPVPSVGNIPHIEELMDTPTSQSNASERTRETTPPQHSLTSLTMDEAQRKEGTIGVEGRRQIVSQSSNLPQVSTASLSTSQPIRQTHRQHRRRQRTQPYPPVSSHQENVQHSLPLSYPSQIHPMMPDTVGSQIPTSHSSHITPGVSDVAGYQRINTGGAVSSHSSQMSSVRSYTTSTSSLDLDYLGYSSPDLCQISPRGSHSTPTSPHRHQACSSPTASQQSDVWNPDTQTGDVLEAHDLLALSVNTSIIDSLTTASLNQMSSIGSQGHYTGVQVPQSQSQCSVGAAQDPLNDSQAALSLAESLESLLEEHLSHASQMSPHASQMSPPSSQMSPHASQMSPHAYASQMSPPSSQMSPHASQMSPHAYASQMSPHASQISPHASQMSPDHSSHMTSFESQIPVTTCPMSQSTSLMTGGQMSVSQDPIYSSGSHFSLRSQMSLSGGQVISVDDRSLRPRMSPNRSPVPSVADPVASSSSGQMADFRDPMEQQQLYGYMENPDSGIPSYPGPMFAIPQEAGATSQEGQPRLWKFVLDLLEDPRYNPSLITWVSRSEGIFRLVDQVKLAEYWGRVKGNRSMNYEKLSRGLRYYYNHDVLEHVPGKLVYKFGPSAQVWPYLAQTAHPYGYPAASSTVTSQYPPHTSFQ